jgi:D-3-phosphoglycerate dehydrogenase
MLKDKTVLVHRPIHPEAMLRLQQKVQVLAPFDASDSELLALLPRAHAILLGASLHMGPDNLDRCQRLEILARHGVGLDNVDVDAATERGIPVAYTPYGPTESTAEHALLLIMAASRRLSQLDRAVRSGDFGIGLRQEAMGHELRGKCLGVVGFGRIGQRLATMCRAALEMTVLVHDPHLPPDVVTDWGAEPVDDLCSLAGRVDILTVHTPLTTSTRHLIDTDVIQAMKPGSILINTSRGPVVDQAALISALQSGHLGGAGIDVFDPEPPKSTNPLLEMDHVVLTPHVASFTYEGRHLMSMTVVDDILTALSGHEPKYLANPGIWARRRKP